MSNSRMQSFNWRRIEIEWIMVIGIIFGIPLLVHFSPQQTAEEPQIQNQVFNCSQNLSREEFEGCVLTNLHAVDLKGINPEYLLAMADLETDYGQGGIYQHTKNYFSIKGERESHGSTYFAGDYYRRYNDDLQAIYDVVRLLSTRKRYHKAYIYALMDERVKFFNELQRSGYSEDKYYAKSLERVFKLYKSRQIAQRITQSQSMANSGNYCFTCEALY